VPKRLADRIMEDYHFATHRESWVIYRYKDGCYQPDGEATIRELCRRELGELATEHHVSETVKQIQDVTFRNPADFVSPKNLICLENGVLDLDTSELKPHSPNPIFLNKLPVKYDPKARASVCGKYFREWMGEDDAIRAIQFMGFLLYREYFIRKAVLCVGEGGNGKSTFITYLARWIGEENASSVSVQDLDQNRFSPVLLHGKLGNLCDDLPSADWFQTGRFKQATGGAPMQGEIKFQTPFNFTNYAKMLFTANRLPLVNDDTRAFWERIMIISFPNHFDGSKSREEILAEMLTQEERSGVLNAALVGLRMLLRKGDFYKPEDLDSVRSRYIHMSDPAAAFAEDCIAEDQKEMVPKEQLYSEYVRYCQEHGFSPVMNSVFPKLLKRIIPTITVGRPTIDGIRTWVWNGIRLKTPEERESESSEGERKEPPLDVQGVQDVQEISLLVFNTVIDFRYEGKIEKTPDTLDTPDKQTIIKAGSEPTVQAETGVKKAVISVTQQGGTLSQWDKAHIVMAVIAELEDKYEGTAPIGEVYAISVKKGVDQAFLDEFIKEEKFWGHLYEPKTGYLSRAVKGFLDDEKGAKP
jgi:putative DNA primase/helicase